MRTLPEEYLDTPTDMVARIDRLEIPDADSYPMGPILASMDNKEQLHQRVKARLSDLQIALDQLDAPLSQGERGRALVEAMATAKSSMSGGWDRVGEVEAAHLAHWLKTTEDLRVTSPGIPTVPLPSAPEPQNGIG
ncbi:MAG: hypothetical protein JNJ46_22390 [Myxococcales bacterium]|nr:hypothetical protein [Myxococcales bacterium]